MEDFDWEQHADDLDAQVSILRDRDLVEERLQTLRELAENGKTLKDKGLAYLNETENPFEENPSAAVRAVVAGSEMQFKYAGQADMLAKVTQMTDKQLDSMMKKLLGKNDDENTIDAEEITEADEDAESDND